MYEMHNECYFIHKESSYDIFIQETIELWKKKGQWESWWRYLESSRLLIKMKVVGYRVELAIVENRQWSRWDSHNIPLWVQKVSEHHPNLFFFIIWAKAVFFFGVKFRQISTWTIWFLTMQRIFHGKKKSQIRQILKEKTFQIARF
jgi:hypothetical protein